MIFFYDVSTQNKVTWNNIPTKTITASCRNDRKTYQHYQPGGVMTIVTNTMTTKIKTSSKDYLGRWTKVSFFATKGTVCIYTIYRPNKSSKSQAGGETVWMQQQRILEQEKDKTEPRSKLIKDLVQDIQNEKQMGTTGIIIAGNFNEDPRDNEELGLNHLMDACNLTNVFESLYDILPSTRNNTRSIDHVLISTHLISKVSKAGIVPKDIGFCKSDHQALFVDIHPSILDTKNIPLLPTSQRKLRFGNAPKVEWYNLKVLERAHDHNIQKRVHNLFKSIREEGFTDDIKSELEKNRQQNDRNYAFNRI